MRDHRLVFAVLALFLLAFVAISTPVKADRVDDVKMFIWNTLGVAPFINSPNYPWKAYSALPAGQTYVQVWIDCPDAWTDTAIGIVSWRVRLHVDPTQVMSITALQYPDSAAFPDGLPDDFLGLYLSLYHPAPEPYGILWAPPLIDDAAGTIEAGEAIAGFTTLAKGSGGAITDIEGTPFPTNANGDELIPLVRFQIRTRQGVTSGGSLLTLFDGLYVTPDSVEHPVEVYAGGMYGTPVVPEFPFGIGILMMIVPAVAVMYLWRRKKVTKP